HHRAVGCLEGDMAWPGRPALRGRAVDRGHAEFVGPEETLHVATQGDAQDLEDRGVEGATRLQVADHDLDVVYEAAAVQFIGFHGGSFSSTCGWVGLGMAPAALVV